MSDFTDKLDKILGTYAHEHFNDLGADFDALKTEAKAAITALVEEEIIGDYETPEGLRGIGRPDAQRDAFRKEQRTKLRGSK